jgi:nucleoside-diphosphate-sugar epimerase
VKVLVTGAGSMLLAGVARTLVERGDDVVCLQRRAVEIPGAQVVQGDVRDAAAVLAAARGCDAIVHGAARVGVVGGWEEFRSVNVAGTEHVLFAAVERSVRRLVYVSTPSVAHSGHSIVGEGAAPAVTGRKGAFYAESKAVAEGLVLAANSPQLAVVAVRPHLVWGPGRHATGRAHHRARPRRSAGRRRQRQRAHRQHVRRQCHQRARGGA